MGLGAAWMVLALGLAQSPGVKQEGTAAPPLPTLGVPGLVLVGGDADDRALLEQQLAAALEGAGFPVKDAAALTAAGARVPAGGCDTARSKPLCGEAPGADQVVLGRVVRNEAGAAFVMLQLVKTGSRKQLWRGTFEVSSEAELVAGLNEVAQNHLPTFARKGHVPEPPRTLGLTRPQWGTAAFSVGSVLVVGSGVLFVTSERTVSRITGRWDVSNPLYTEDVLRAHKTVPMIRAAATAAAVLGVVGMVGGTLLWRDTSPPPLAFTFSPSGDAGGVVFTGVLP